MMGVAKKFSKRKLVSAIIVVISTRWPQLNLFPLTDDVNIY